MANRWFGRDGARLVAGVRILVGVGAIARPTLMPRLLGVDTGSAERMAWLARLFGGREVALGAGLLLARSPEAEREWLLGGALVDAVDAAAFAGAVRRGVIRGALGTAAAATALAVTGTEVNAWLAGRD